jgi:hypothetical protein
MGSVAFRASLALLAIHAWAQTLHNLEVGAAGLFPLSGSRTTDYSAGAGWHPGYELRFLRPVGAEIGYTQAWLPGSSCNRFGCIHPIEPLKLLDYGLRGHLMLDDGRVDLSAGAGGGYVWYRYGNSFTNISLFQYSGKAAIALDHRKHFRIAFTLRAWRDLGRPTQQWLSTSGGLIFGFGGLP